MPTHTLEDELYNKYDIVVGKIFEEIMNSVNGNKAIRLLQFSRKDKEHLLVLRVALIAREIYRIPVEIDCSWKDRFILNWKIRKNFDKINRVAKNSTKGAWVPHILDLVRLETNFAFDFGDIYKTYYEGSLD